MIYYWRYSSSKIPVSMTCNHYCHVVEQHLLMIPICHFTFPRRVISFAHDVESILIAIQKTSHSMPLRGWHFSTLWLPFISNIYILHHNSELVFLIHFSGTFRSNKLQFPTTFKMSKLTNYNKSIQSHDYISMESFFLFSLFYFMCFIIYNARIV